LSRKCVKYILAVGIRWNEVKKGSMGAVTLHVCNPFLTSKRPPSPSTPTKCKTPCVAQFRGTWIVSLFLEVNLDNFLTSESSKSSLRLLWAIEEWINSLFAWQISI
jgi:hypothetical protein